MTTPAVQRVAGAQQDGYVAAGGVTALRRMMLPKAAASEFEEWSRGRVTCLVRDALRDLALNGPAHVGATDASVQYGMTVGLNLALQLVTDPSIVYPELFTGVMQRTAPAPSPDYSTSIESVLDRSDPKKG